MQKISRYAVNDAMQIHPVSIIKMITRLLHWRVKGLLMVVFTTMAPARIIRDIPMGIMDFMISSLRPYLLDRDRPMKLPTVFTLERNIML
jgi:hypothetical protein